MNKKIVFFSWLAVVLSLFIFYIIKPEFFQPEQLQEVFAVQNIGLGLIIYFIIGTLRGFTLLPSTVLLVAGILVFPPLPFYIVTVVCVFTSSTIVYMWGKYLGFDKYFMKKYPKQVTQLQKKLQQKELPVLIAWSFFPFVPTDLICYASETLQIKLWKCLVGVGIGEAVIGAIYIFGGSSLLHLII